MASVIEFDSQRATRYIERVFAGFLSDPADSDYQRAYLAAHLDMYRECFGKGENDDRLKLLDAQVRAA